MLLDESSVASAGRGGKGLHLPLGCRPSPSVRSSGAGSRGLGRGPKGNSSYRLAVLDDSAGLFTFQIRNLNNPSGPLLVEQMRRELFPLSRGG